LNEGSAAVVVTLGGECFRATYQRPEASHDKDGVLYLFALEDLKDQKRGERLVSLFRSGQDKVLRPNHDAIIDNVRINCLRRAFDSHTLSFDVEHEEHKYQEIIIRPQEFEPRAPVSDEQVRQFIIHKAYWLGYRFNPHQAPIVPVQFDNPIDLEYLGVTSDTMRRNIGRLGAQHRLEKIMECFARPTEPFLQEYEKELAGAGQKKDERKAEVPKINSRDVFLVHGHDIAMQQTVARFLEKLKLSPIILSEQANKGRTIIEKFEAHSDVPFAVVLLSADDFGGTNGKPSSPRARQNVILELGYFIGKLGRANVCPLHDGVVELPSDLHGVVWVAYEGDWKMRLAKEIKAAGIDVELESGIMTLREPYGRPPLGRR